MLRTFYIFLFTFVILVNSAEVKRINLPFSELINPTSKVSTLNYSFKYIANTDIGILVKFDSKKGLTKDTQLTINLNNETKDGKEVYSTNESTTNEIFVSKIIADQDNVLNLEISLENSLHESYQVILFNIDKSSPLNIKIIENFTLTFTNVSYFTDFNLIIPDGNYSFIVNSSNFNLSSEAFDSIKPNTKDYLTNLVVNKPIYILVDKINDKENDLTISIYNNDTETITDQKIYKSINHISFSNHIKSFLIKQTYQVNKFNVTPKQIGKIVINYDENDIKEIKFEQKDLNIKQTVDISSDKKNDITVTYYMDTKQSSYDASKSYNLFDISFFTEIKIIDAANIIDVDVKPNLSRCYELQYLKSIVYNPILSLYIENIDNLDVYITKDNPYYAHYQSDKDLKNEIVAILPKKTKIINYKLSLDDVIYHKIYLCLSVNSTKQPQNSDFSIIKEQNYQSIYTSDMRFNLIDLNIKKNMPLYISLRLESQKNNILMHVNSPKIDLEYKLISSNDSMTFNEYINFDIKVQKFYFSNQMTYVNFYEHNKVNEILIKVTTQEEKDIICKLFISDNELKDKDTYLTDLFSYVKLDKGQTIKLNLSSNKDSLLYNFIPLAKQIDSVEVKLQIDNEANNVVKINNEDKSLLNNIQTLTFEANEYSQEKGINVYVMIYTEVKYDYKPQIIDNNTKVTTKIQTNISHYYLLFQMDYTKQYKFIISSSKVLIKNSEYAIISKNKDDYYYSSSFNNNSTSTTSLISNTHINESIVPKGNLSVLFRIELSSITDENNEFTISILELKEETYSLVYPQYKDNLSLLINFNNKRTNNIELYRSDNKYGLLFEIIINENTDCFVASQNIKELNGVQVNNQNNKEKLSLFANTTSTQQPQIKIICKENSTLEYRFKFFETSYIKLKNHLDYKVKFQLSFKKDEGKALATIENSFPDSSFSFKYYVYSNNENSNIKTIHNFYNFKNCSITYPSKDSSNHISLSLYNKGSIYDIYANIFILEENTGYVFNSDSVKYLSVNKSEMPEKKKEREGISLKAEHIVLIIGGGIIALVLIFLAISYFVKWMKSKSTSHEENLLQNVETIEIKEESNDGIN